MGKVQDTATKVTEFFSTEQEVLDALEVADSQASTSYEMEFVSSFRTRFGRYGMGSYMTEKQHAVLMKIIDRRHR